MGIGSRGHGMRWRSLGKLQLSFIANMSIYVVFVIPTRGLGALIFQRVHAVRPSCLYIGIVLIEY